MCLVSNGLIAITPGGNRPFDQLLPQSDMPTPNKPLLKKLAPDSVGWPSSASCDHRRSFPTRIDQDSATVVGAAGSRDNLHTSATSRQAQTDDDDEWGAWVDARDGNHSSTLQDERREEDEWAAWAEDSATPLDVGGDSEQVNVSQSARRSMREAHDLETSPWDSEESSSSFVSPGLENLVESNDAANDLHSNPWDDGADRKGKGVLYPSKRKSGVQESRERHGARRASKVLHESVSDQRRDDEQSVQFNPWNDG